MARDTALYTTRTSRPLDIRGSGDGTRIEVQGHVHSGIAPAVGRAVNLILTRDEAFKLATDILSNLPIGWLISEADPKGMRRLDDVRKLIEVSRED